MAKSPRLPRDVREELNERLERSEKSPQLLAWLNALKEVKEVLRDAFAGVPISKQNLMEIREEDLEKSKRSREKSVKPTETRVTAKRARKTRPHNVDKPLEENKIESGKEEESSQDQSKPVKVNQTDLTPAVAEAMAGKPGLRTDEAKECPEDGSGPLCPIRPIGPISQKV